ncbi:4-hydroxy-tetrahydrodipicolinate reductase [Candidatus Woesearchaeota archaeon]|nr:4-hydroxy-tetrahydrodipicolinate reductase [Candidatus Woesearchaeota archaeon]
MKIAIVGYGRMGHEIEAAAKSKGHEIVRVDNKCRADFCGIDKNSMAGVDVAIDFTAPESAINNAGKYNELGVNAVIGTTGWYGSMEKMKEAARDIGLIWSGNFSMGVNVFFRIIENAAKMMNNLDNYDVSAFEMHHKGKKDSPSGTAKMIGDIILRNIDRKKKLETGQLSRKIGDDELHFASVRGGSAPGTHSVFFDSDADTIELTHRARSRKGFALGAVTAAEWIKDRKGFYNIDDMMSELIK